MCVSYINLFMRLYIYVLEYNKIFKYMYTSTTYQHSGILVHAYLYIHKCINICMHTDTQISSMLKSQYETLNIIFYVQIYIHMCVRGLCMYIYVCSLCISAAEFHLSHPYIYLCVYVVCLYKYTYIYFVHQLLNLTRDVDV